MICPELMFLGAIEVQGIKFLISMHLLHSSIVIATYCAIAALAYLQSQANAGNDQHREMKASEQMAVATNTSALKGAHSNALNAWIEAAKTRFASYRMYRQTVNELSNLSDRELADLGLHRSMIRRLAKQAADEHTAR